MRRRLARPGSCSELLAAQAEYRLPRYLRNWQTFDLIILGELGYLGLGPGGLLLFQFCAEMYERRSLCITSNLDFSRWVEVFTDSALTAALLDRLTHHCHVLLFRGKSYRFQESRERLMQPATSVATTPRSAYGWSTLRLSCRSTRQLPNIEGQTERRAARCA